MIKSKKVVVIFVALSSFLLAGCDSPKDANKQNFEKAINTRLEKECITISPLGMFDSKPYPVQVAVAQANRYTSQERADEINSRQFSALDVLVKADLLGVSLDIKNYCTLRLLFNQSLVLDKVPEYGKPAKCCSP